MDNDKTNVDELWIQYLKFHKLPLPAALSLEETSLRAVVAITCNEKKHRYLVPRDVLCSASSLVQSLLSDVGDDASDEVPVIPLDVPVAMLPAVAIVVSWLHSSSAAEPPLTTQVPYDPNVQTSPGSTGGRGGRMVDKGKDDRWVVSCLQELFPPIKSKIRVSKKEVTRRAISALEADASPPHVDVEVTIGIQGLALLHTVSQLSVFMQIHALAELCTAYTLHHIKSAIQDERAFGVAQKIQQQQPPAVARNGNGGGIHATSHFAGEIIRHSLLTPPVPWSSMMPSLDAVFPFLNIAMTPEDLHLQMGDALEWLRATCTDMRV